MRVFELGDALLMDLEPAAGRASSATASTSSIFSEDAQVEDAHGSTRAAGRLRSGAAAVVVAQALGAGCGVSARSRRLPLYANQPARASGRPESSIARERRDRRRTASTCSCTRAAGRRDRRSRCARPARSTSAPRRPNVARIEAGRPRVRRRHGRRHDPARGRHRGSRDQPDEGLLCRTGDHHPRPAPRPGPVARRLVGLALDAVSVRSCSAATRIRVGGSARSARVTSAAFSPALGRPIALGYVHRDFAEPGTQRRPSMTAPADAAQPSVTALSVRQSAATLPQPR